MPNRGRVPYRALGGAILGLLVAIRIAYAQPQDDTLERQQQEPPGVGEAPGGGQEAPADEPERSDAGEAEPSRGAPAGEIDGSPGSKDGEPQADGADHYAEQDLIAQRTMAEKTSELVALTWVQTIIGALGILGLLASLEFTRRALRLSREANEATVRAAEDTRKIGQAQVRAYLVCEGAEFIATPEYLSCTVKLRNVGQSPAIECRLSGRVARNYLSRTPEKTKLIWLESEPTDVRGPVISAASRETAYILWTRGSLFEGYATDIVEDQADFIIDCRAEWTDVFGERGSLFFTLSLDFDSDGKQSDTVRAGLMNARNGSAEQQRQAQEAYAP